MNLSEHLTLEQFTKSQTASRNNITEQFTPPDELLENGNEWAGNFYYCFLI